MNDDLKTILDMADQGFSRAEVSTAIGVTVRKLDTLIRHFEISPNWRRHCRISSARRNKGQPKPMTEAVAAALGRANQAKRDKEEVMAFGEMAFPIEHWRKRGVTSLGGFKRRYYEKKWTIEAALTTPRMK